MRRLSAPLLVCPALLLVLASACSDNTTGVKAVPNGQRPAVVTPTGSLDENIVAILALLPKGLETAATTRWSNVKAKYAAGLSDPSQMAVAKQMLFELSDWVNQKAPGMDAPLNNETRSAAAARAVRYMSMYVYTGPTTPPPAFMPSADVVFGIVTPGAPATIVTPTKHAGVQLDAGSVAENTIVVITQNPTAYPDNCSGPLQTRLCQYPQFYSFDEFPHQALLKPAKFNVCHVNSGENRRPLADHDRFRLAHTKPANPADYTPGSTIRDQNGENIEVLPLVAQTFSTCVGNDYPSATIAAGPMGVLSQLAYNLKKLVTPKSAYAIDLGLGGISKSMSDFNDVDSLGVPDRIVQAVTLSSSSGGPGDHLDVAFTVGNIGTATGSKVAATVRLVSAEVIEGPPPVNEILGVDTIPALVPEAATTIHFDAVVPEAIAPGSYTISVTAGDDPLLPDTAVANNTAASPFDVVVSEGATIAAGSSFACAIMTGGVGYCWGNNAGGQLGTGTVSAFETTPVPITGNLRFTEISATDETACGVTVDHRGYCWGSNAFGQIGDGTATARNAPVEVAGNHVFKSIAAGSRISCGLTPEGIAWCWGSTNIGTLPSGTLGDGVTTASNIPVAVAADRPFTSITVGIVHACGLDASGNAYCWGSNSFRALGVGDGLVRNLPAVVVGNHVFSQLAAGHTTVCGVENGAGWCWGSDFFGDLGVGFASPQPILQPTRVAGNVVFRAIRPASGNDVLSGSCGLSTDGSASCWGSNSRGQLGATADSSCSFAPDIIGCTTHPTAVDTEIRFRELAGGGEFVCAVAISRQIYCWGRNGSGQLGNGSNEDVNHPIAVQTNLLADAR